MQSVAWYSHFSSASGFKFAPVISRNYDAGFERTNFLYYFHFELCKWTKKCSKNIKQRKKSSFKLFKSTIKFYFHLSFFFLFSFCVLFNLAMHEFGRNFHENSCGVWQERGGRLKLITFRRMVDWALSNVDLEGRGGKPLWSFCFQFSALKKGLLPFSNLLKYSPRSLHHVKISKDWIQFKRKPKTPAI